MLANVKDSQIFWEKMHFRTSLRANGNGPMVQYLIGRNPDKSPQ